MRSYDPNNTNDQKEAKRILAEPWMLDLLAINPEYPYWGPHEDYMCEPDAGWRSPIFHETWKDCDITLDELNEVVNFYFYIDRASKQCPSCKSGYSSEAERMYDDFYGHNGEASRWRGRITLDDARALVEHRRCLEWDANSRRMIVPEINDALVARINAENAPGARGLGHDALDLGVMIEARCKRLGVSRLCAQCDGHALVFTADHPHVGVVLWLLHPRKGASRGVQIKRVEREELPAVFEFLAQAAKRNADRFAKVVSRVR